MNYLTVEQIIAINQVVVEESGGSTGLMNPGALESIAIKPQTSLYSQEMYPDIFLKAAVIYEAIINGHVFIDGNKRTGLAAIAYFLHLNGYELGVTDKEMEDYTIAIAADRLDLADIAQWVKKHSQEIRDK